MVKSVHVPESGLASGSGRVRGCDNLCFPIYEGKQTSVLRNGCEVLENKNNQILKRIISYKWLFRPSDLV